jgi:hypothetical protein
MSLKNKAAQKLRSFDLPVSYRINESRPRLRDALNVISNQGRLETRNGRTRVSLLSGSVLSMSFFKQADGTRLLLAKVGDTIYSVNSAGVATSIKTGLSATTKHRGFTWNKGINSRHIIAIENDGLFQYDGTSFTALGQAVPTSPSVASSATTGTLGSTSYNVYLTYYSSVTGFETNKSTAVTCSVAATLAVQDLTYTAKLLGAEGNLISITYTSGATAGAEVVTVSNNAITVQIAAATTTANQIKTLIERSTTASALVSVAVTGTGTAAQAAATIANLSTGRKSIAVTSIPTTATNATIDKVRLYMKASTSAADPAFVTELSLGTSSYTISADATSSITPPNSHSAPLSGGGKYLAEFNSKLVYAGNGTYKNDVFFSETDFPDAFNDGTANGRIVLSPLYGGEITGLATGLYSNTIIDPYLVVFKKRSIHIYSEIGDQPKFVPISKEIGCVSHDTIQVKNGDVYFLSDQGWRVISNGRLVVNEQGNPATLGNSDIDDIFRSPGYVYALNKTQFQNAFSVYYSALDQYLTWVPEGSSTSLTKTYSYEFKTTGFKPYQFYTASTCACIGEDSSGYEVVFMADSTGAIYKHSINEARSDEDAVGTAQPIEAFAMLTWMDGDDMESSHNFRELLLRRVVGGGDLTVKTWLNYNVTDLLEASYSFGSTIQGPQWDEAVWDADIWTDERTIETARSDVNRVGENILIGFYQNEIGSNMGLVSAQLEFSKNGNRNL